MTRATPKSRKPQRTKKAGKWKVVEVPTGPGEQMYQITNGVVSAWEIDRKRADWMMSRMRAAWIGGVMHAKKS